MDFKKKLLVALTIVWIFGITFGASASGFGTWSLVSQSDANTLSANITNVILMLVATITALSAPMLYKYFWNRAIALIERVFGGKS